MLTDILTGSLRRKFYVTFALIGVTLGSIQVGFAAAQVGQPTWLTVAFAVFGFVATAFGFTASANVPNADGRYEAGRTEDLQSLNRMVSFEVPEDLSAVTLVINGEDCGTVPARNGTVNYVLDKSILNGTVTVTALNVDGEQVADESFTFG